MLHISHGFHYDFAAENKTFLASGQSVMDFKLIVMAHG
jgi:hypothetical protein